MRFLYIVTAIALLNTISCVQHGVGIPKGFVEAKTPIIESAEWRDANYSSNEFVVSFTNGKLEVSRLGQTGKTDSCKLTLEDGTLLGIDRGEWGGALTFTPNSKQNEQTIKRGNIKFIFKYNGKIYFIEGLAHLSNSEGALYELQKKDTAFTYNKILDFDDAPEAFTICNNQFLIATYKNFFIVTNFKKQLIFKDVFWSGLCPNSIAAIDDKSVFLGMRSGIAKLDLKNKKLKYYKWVGN